MAIQTVETGAGADPDIALNIFQEAVDTIAGKAILIIDV
jgi:hypothetical protein